MSGSIVSLIHSVRTEEGIGFARPIVTRVSVAAKRLMQAARVRTLTHVVRSAANGNALNLWRANS